MDEINNIPIVQDIFKAVEFLKEGKIITRYEYGDSMKPILFSGEYARVRPVISPKDEISIGDGVLCKVNNYYMIHMVLDKKDDIFLISSTKETSYIFGWTKDIYGIAESWEKYIGKRIYNK